MSENLKIKINDYLLNQSQNPVINETIARATESDTGGFDKFEIANPVGLLDKEKIKPADMRIRTELRTLLTRPLMLNLKEGVLICFLNLYPSLVASYSVPTCLIILYFLKNLK